MIALRAMAWPLVAVGAVVLAAVGCGGPASVAEPGFAGGLIVVQAPAGAVDTATVDVLEPSSRFPDGSRVVVVQGDPPVVHHVVSTGLVAAGAPALSADGRRVLFAGKKTAASVWAVYEASLDRGRPRAVLERTGDCSDPAYLPGGRFVAACRDDAKRWSLFRADANGDDLQRITFGPHDALRPTVLADGRILFSMYQGPGAGRADGTTAALFTVNPDGTLLDAFAGSHERAEKFGARQVDDDTVVVLERSSGRAAPFLSHIDFQRPHRGGTRLLAAATDDAPLAFEAVGVAADGRLLVALPGSTGDLALYRTPFDGNGRELAFDEAGRDDIAAVAIRRREPPRGRPSPVDDAVASGTLVCYDSARSDGVVGPVDPDPGRAVLRTIGADGAVRPLGELSVEHDGSFFVNVPADVPLQVATLDRNGRTIAASDWFWVRPGERRACFGCHEARDAAPVNRTIAALAGEPVELVPARGAAP